MVTVNILACRLSYASSTMSYRSIKWLIKRDAHHVRRNVSNFGINESVENHSSAACESVCRETASCGRYSLK